MHDICKYVGILLHLFLVRIDSFLSNVPGFANALKLQETSELCLYRVFIKYCVFSKNSRKSATSPSVALGCYWLYKKITSQLEWLWIRIALRALRVSYSNVGEGGVTVNCEKNTIFPEHPVLYLLYNSPRIKRLQKKSLPFQTGCLPGSRITT